MEEIDYKKLWEEAYETISKALEEARELALQASMTLIHDDTPSEEALMIENCYSYAESKLTEVRNMVYAQRGWAKVEAMKKTLKGCAEFPNIKEVTIEEAMKGEKKC